MSGTLLVDDVLTLAEAIYLQLRSCRDLPSDIHDILAISSPQSDDASFGPIPSSADTPANQQSADSHVSQSLYSVHHQGDYSELCVKDGEVTPTNDDSSIEILSSESV